MPDDPTKPQRPIRPQFYSQVVVPLLNSDEFKQDADVLLSAHLNQTDPLAQNVETREGGGAGVPLPTRATVFGMGQTVSQGAAALLMDLFSPKKLTSTTGGPPTPGAPVIDITAPNVEVGEYKLSAADQRVRNLRMLGAGLQAAVTGGLSEEGIKMAIRRGEIAMPHTREEEIVLGIAPMLAQLALFLPVGAAAGGVRAGIGLAEQGVMRVFPRLAAYEAGLLAEGGTAATAAAGAAVPAGFAAVSGGLTGSRAINAALGLMSDIAIGYGFEKAPGIGVEAQARAQGAPISAEEANQAARQYMLWGAGLGSLFRARSLYRIARGLPRYAGLVSTAVAAERGAVETADRVAVRSRLGQLQWRWKPGTVVSGEPVGGRLAPAPPPAALTANAEQLGIKMTQLASTDPAAIAVAEKAKTAVPGEPTAPPDMNALESEIRLRGADYYTTRIWQKKRYYESQGTPWQFGMKSELENVLSPIYDDPLQPEGMRVAAGAKALAIKRALDMDTGGTTGALPFDQEVMALEFVRANQQAVTLQGIKRLAAEYFELPGASNVANRVVQIAQALPKLRSLSTEFKQIRDLGTELQTVSSRGFASKSMGMGPDGKVYELATNPRYGRALARDLSNPAQSEPVEVAVADLTPLPTAGRYVRTTGNRTLQVKELDLGNQTFSATDVGNGSEVIGVSFKDIAEVADSPAAFKDVEYERAKLGRVMAEGGTEEAGNIPEQAAQTVPVPPVEAGTITGEPVVVDGVGQQQVSVKKRGGKRTTMPRSRVVPTTRGSKPAPSPAEKSAPETPVQPVTVEGVPLETLSPTTRAALDLVSMSVKDTEGVINSARMALGVGPQSDRYWATVERLAGGPVDREIIKARHRERLAMVGEAAATTLPQPAPAAPAAPQVGVATGLANKSEAYYAALGMGKAATPAAPAVEGTEWFPLPAEAAPEAAPMGIPGLAGQLAGTDPLSRMARAAQAPLKPQPTVRLEVPRRLVDFGPGTLPDAEHKNLFFRIPKDMEAAFNEAYINGRDLSPFLVDGIHVLPPSTADPAFKLYALEVPRDYAPPKRYHKDAWNNVHALDVNRPERAATYRSPVGMSGTAATKSRVFPVPDEVWHAAMVPESELQAMGLADHKAYLKNLIVMHVPEGMSDEIATATAGMRHAQEALKEAVAKQDGPAMVEAKQAMARANVDALEAVVAVNDETPAIMERALAAARAESQLAKSRYRFETEGLTPETADEWLHFIEDTETTPEGLVGEYIPLQSAIERGQRLHIYKYVAPQPETVRAPDVTGAQGIVKGAPMRGGQRVYYDLVPYAAHGQVLHDARVQVNTPEEVAAYVERNHYLPRAARVFVQEYTNKSGSISVRIRPTKRGRFEVVQEEKIRAPQPHEEVLPLNTEQEVALMDAGVPWRVGEPLTAEQNKILIDRGIPQTSASRATGMPAEQRKLWLEIGTAGEDPLSGASYYVERALVDSPSMRDAIEWMNKWFVDKNGAPVLERVDALERVNSASSRFAKLPELNAIADNPQELERAYHEIGKLMQVSIQLRRAVPIPMAEYAERFSEVFLTYVAKHPEVKELGGIWDQAPWNKVMRHYISLPTLEDLEPHLSQSVLDPAEIMDISDAKSRSVGWGWSIEGNPIMEPGDEPVIRTQMHVPMTQLNIVPKDTKAFFRRYMGMDVHTPKETQTLLQRYIADARQDRWSAAYARSQYALDVENAHITDANLAETATGQIVEIVDPKIGEPDVIVRFPGEGNEVAMAKDALTPLDMLRGSEAIADVRHYHHTLAQLAHEVPPLTSVPELGFGTAERALGLTGIRDETLVAQAFGSRAMELAQDMHVTTKGRTLGKSESTDELIELYQRAQELSPPTVRIDDVKGTDGIETVIQGRKQYVHVTPRAWPGIEAPKGARAGSIEQAVMDAVKAVDPELERPFRYAVYWRTRRALSGPEHVAWADLFATAKAGDLNKQQLSTLYAWAKDSHLSASLPPAKIVSELFRQGQFVEHASLTGAEYARQMGIGLWLEQAGMDAGEVIVKAPGPIRDIHLAGKVGIPWKLPERHPHPRLVNEMMLGSSETQQRSIHATIEEWQRIMGMGYNADQMATITRLVGTFPSWDAAEAAGIKGVYHQGYDAMKAVMNEGLYRVIRLDMLEGIVPQPYTGGPAEIRALERAGIDTRRIKHGVYLGYTDPAIGPRVSRGFNAEQIERFIELLPQYGTGEAIPEEVFREFASVRMPRERFNRYFNFWKNYGIPAYYPLVHEGNTAIMLGDQTLAWSSNHFDSRDIIEKLVDDGVLHFGPGGRLVEDVHFESKVPIIDDIIHQYAKPGAPEWRRIVEAMKSQMDLKPDEVRALFIVSEKPEVGRVPQPWLAHAQPRTANLKPVIEDPFHAFAVWNARIARAEHRMRLRHAWDTLHNRDLDRALSDGQNVPHFWKNDRESNFPQLQQFMENHIKSALGEQTWFEKRQEDLIMYFHRLRHAPPLIIKKALGGEVPFSYHDLWSAEGWKTRYGARVTAGSLVGMQSKYRLFSSLSSGVANATQYLSTTVPELLRLGVPPVKASEMAGEAWWDALRVYRYAVAPGTPAPEVQAMADLLNEIPHVSFQPAKYEAGGAGSAWVLSKGIPAKLDKTPIQHAWDIFMWIGMLPFDAAEAMNRYATALVGYRVGQMRGLSHLASVAHAGRMVRRTQFLYDELAIPHGMSMMGPLGRVLFQFRPFIFNMLSFEKELMFGALPWKPNWQQSLYGLIAHTAVLGALGGTVGVMGHPALEFLSSLPGFFGIHTPLEKLSATRMAARARARRRESMTGEEQMAGLTGGKSIEDLLLYGVPGVLGGMSIGQRVGVAGQDVSSIVSLPNMLGPSLGIYYDFINAAQKYVREPGSALGAAGGLFGGVVLPMALEMGPRPVRNFAQNAFRMPLMSMVWGLSGAVWASKGAEYPAVDFLNNTREGRTLLSRDLATAARNWMRSFQMTMYGRVKTLNGSTVYIPVENTADELAYTLFHRYATEGGQGEKMPLENLPVAIPSATIAAFQNPDSRAALFGLPTIRAEEYSAVMDLINSKNEEVDQMRSSITDRIAQAVVDDDMEKVMKLLSDAERRGIEIKETSIKQAAQALLVDALEGRRAKASVAARYPEQEEE